MRKFEDADRRQMDAHPLSEFLGEVARGVGQGVESLVCTLARKPLPVNAALLADARVLMRMRSGARARQADEMVRMLGGRVVERADMATHCVVSEGLRAHDLGDLREDLEICQALEVTVVEPSWVEAAAKIARTEREVNWNAVLVDSYVSPVMALLSCPPDGQVCVSHQTALRWLHISQDPIASPSPPPTRISSQFTRVGILAATSLAWAKEARCMRANSASPSLHALRRL